MDMYLQTTDNSVWQYLAGTATWYNISNITGATGPTGTTLVNGTSNVEIPVADGNINFTSNGNTTLIVTDTGAVLGNGTGGDLTGGNLISANSIDISATANFEAASNVTLGAVGNIHITGGSSGYVLATDGANNLSWVSRVAAPAGNTTEVQFNDSGNFDATSNLTFDKNTNLFTVVGNVSANAITANSLVAATAGNLTVTGNLLPLNNTYSLGLSTNPWQDAFFGPRSITVLDNTGNLANSVIIENIAANIVLSTTGFTINEFGTSNAIFRIEAITGQIFSNALTIIANATNSSNTSSGSLQTAGGAGIAKDLYVGGNIYGEGKQLSNVVTYVTAGVGLSGGGTGNVGLNATGVQSITGTANRVIVTDLGGQNFNLSTPQDLNTSSTLTFGNLTITGNLTVNGTTTTANSANLDSKVLYLAANSTSNTQIDQGGIILGNNSSSYKVSILYDLPNNSWNTDGAGFHTGNLIAANANIDFLNVQNGGHFGLINEKLDYPNAYVQVDANVNSYSQIVSQNHSPGTSASSDLVLVNDIGDDGNHYIDMGINSSNYTDPAFSSTVANDGYLFVNKGNLVIGTDTAAKTIKFVAGGTTSSNIIATISNTGISTSGNVSATTGLTSNGVVNFANTSNVTLGAVANLHITGGSANNILLTNGSGNLSWASISTVNGVGGNQLVFVLNAVHSLTSLKNTLQSLFGLTNGVTLASNTRYQYELVFNMQFNKSGVLTYALALGSGVAVAQHNYQAEANQTNTLIGYTAGVTMMSQNATGATITTGTAIGDTNNGYAHYIVRGTIDVTTGGNVNFMISQDQNTPITWSTLTGSYIKLIPLGAIGANTAAGTWS